jgi:thymidine phosphorylase
VGIRVHTAIGRTVEVGQPVFTVVHAHKGIDEALALLRQGLSVVPG